MAIIEVQGSSEGSVYKVDTEKLSCTCPQFKYRCIHHPITNPDHLCKHLVRVFDEHPELAPVWIQKQKAEAEVEIEQVFDGPDPDGKTRYPIGFFDTYVYDIKALIGQYSDMIERYEFCGSYRRRQPRVSDLDVLMVVRPGFDINRMYDYCENVLGFEKLWRGDKKASYKIDGIVQVDFKVVPEASWPFAILHYTGSKSHNIRMRQRAIALGYSLSEYGLKGKDEEVASDHGCKTEEDIFKFLRLPYLKPEER